MTLKLEQELKDHVSLVTFNSVCIVEPLNIYTVLRMKEIRSKNTKKTNFTMKNCNKQQVCIWTKIIVIIIIIIIS